MKKGFSKITIVAAVLTMLFACTFPASAAGIQLQMSDVWSVVQSTIPYLAAFLAFFVIAIVVMICCKKLKRPVKKLVRGEAWITIVIAFVLSINFILSGPLSALLDVTTAGASNVSKTTTAQTKQLVTQISGEGAVLLKNDDGTLPLSPSEKKLNVFGWASTNPCYGGSGSGSVDTKSCVTLLGGLKDAGYEVNQTLIDMYHKYRGDRPSVSMFSQDWTLPEPPVSSYTSDIMNHAKSFSDVAVVVLTRVGGEGADLPMNMGAKNADGTPKYTYKNNSTAYKDFDAGESYLQISKTEENLVKTVCNNFKKVIVVYNGANAFQLGWVNQYKQIKSVITFPGAGQTGFDALGKILDGETNPSGKLADTYVYDLTKTPSFNNFGDFSYDNTKEFNFTTTDFVSKAKVTNGVHFVDYDEGIYVGYRYYETAYAEAQAGRMHNFNYASTVQYPFGYGLSYTKFSQKITNSSVSDGKINLTVTVTNTGKTAGKDAVELYYTPPYTNGGIEKASVNLADYAKTDILQPGASQTISFTLNQDSMASFDTNGAGCYVLDPGVYNISLRSDSHTVLDSINYTVGSKIVYGKNNPRSSDKTAATTQFNFAEGKATYLSRKNGFANYNQATAAPTDFSMDSKTKATFFNNNNYSAAKYDNSKDVMPTLGVNKGVALKSLRGKSFNDPLWNTLLDELSVSDMNNLISKGNYQTCSIPSIQKTSTTDEDGPAALYSNYNKTYSTAFPSEVTVANTWNKKLAVQMGELMGKQGNEMGVTGWYAPSMDIHRSAFGGRDFEYYSEDGTLSGYMAASVIQGAREYGLTPYMKHFAMNEQETNRLSQLCTWANEQSIREIYLKPFELAVKDGKVTAAMSSLNFIGTQWSGVCHPLLTTVLRGEWGFSGMVVTDMFGGYGVMNADRAIRAGNDLMLNALNNPYATVSDTSATSVNAMRNASHDILYAVVNSHAYDKPISVTMQGWMKTMMIADIVIAVILVGFEVLVLVNYKKRKQEFNTANETSEKKAG